MQRSSQDVWADFAGPNTAYILEAYERYQADPGAVDDATRAFFVRWGAPPAWLAEGSPGAPPSAVPSAAGLEAHAVAGAVRLAMSIRAHGHRAARLDPLGSEPPGDRALLPENYRIREETLATLPAEIIGGPLARNAGNALAAIRGLRRVYQSSTGYEFEHVSNAEERIWLRNAVESWRYWPPNEPIDERKLLQRLTEVGGFERFLHLAFPGKTRFSLEGLGMMVPMLDEIIGAAAEAGTRCLFLGMAHRGRLNVLAHVVGKPYEQIIAEFIGHFRRPNTSPTETSDQGWTGDVKYHLGARKAYPGGREVEMTVILAPNPSHLEWVDPVVVGMDRAADERRDQCGPALQDEMASVSVLIHGDAAFPGQGIVAETLNLSRLPGYRVGGSIHFITNNQLGFTAGPRQTRSTLYASDLAKGFEIPVIHVNADDPEACVAAARLAHAYRERFRKDVLIDLVGYRRWGHNEGDEPTFTQPLLYARIRPHPTVREQWARELVRRGLMTQEEADGILQAFIERLHGIRRELQGKMMPVEPPPTSGLEAGGEKGGLGHAGPAAEVATAVPEEHLAELNRQLYAIPEGFHLNPKLERPFARRREIVFSRDGDSPENRIEWAHAEALAFASILSDGTPIRLTGQDSARGTFSQRHAVLHDLETGETYTPLRALPAARAAFDVWDSPLSEQATLGFEFGYSLQAPETLVLWEAQYGDFVNVPQVIIDQFLVSARSKWDQQSALILLLPHGYEGQGPEHSSARVERFLQMAAEDNLRIANCTTAAQYFHILRRQRELLTQDPRPLILLTPKSLLRNPASASAPRELSEGRFEPVLDDPAVSDRGRVRRLVLCSGKVYFDLVDAMAKKAGVNGETAGGNGEKRAPGSCCPELSAVRVEELYPFPARDLSRVVESYPNLEEVVWLQEEPRNMGPWTFVAPRLRDLLGARLPLRYVGRTRRASPAEGSYEWHVHDQARLIQDALSFESRREVEPVPIREVEHAR